MVKEEWEREICRKEGEEMQIIVKNSDRAVLKSGILKDAISKQQTGLSL